MKYARLLIWLLRRTYYASKVAYRAAKVAGTHAAVIAICAACVCEDAIRHGMAVLYIWRAEVAEAAEAAAREQDAARPVAEPVERPV